MIKLVTGLAIIVELLLLPISASATPGGNDSSEYYMRLAKAEQEASHFGNAWKFFEKVTVLDPTNADAQMGIADACLQINNRAGAIRGLQAYCDMRPDDINAQQKLTKLYFRYDHWDEVIKLALQLTTRFPSDNNLVYMLGKAYYGRQDYDNSQRYLQAYVKVAPNDAEVLYIIAHIYKQTNNPGAGILYYQKSLAIDSITQNQQRLYEYALVLYAADKFAESVLVFEKIQQKGYVIRNDFFHNYANALAGAHQGGKATDVLNKLISTRPNDVELLQWSADICYESGIYETAIGYLQRIYDIDNSNGRSIYQMGLCYRRMGKEAKAHEFFERAISIDPSLGSLKSKS